MFNGNSIRPLQILVASVIPLTLVSCREERANENMMEIPPGFQVDTLYSPSLNERGSWISLTEDDRGRLIASSESGRLFRITPAPIGSDTGKTRVEEIDADIGHAHGLLWAFNSLYTVVSSLEGVGGHNTGLYRLRDNDGDDRLESVELLTAFSVDVPEHGTHGIVLGPDGRHIYLVAGNHADLPHGYTSRIHPSWSEDNLFPAILDPRGHAANRHAPGGWIARTDSLGHDWEIWAVGLRNPYDLVFNASGDLFTFDADMEWDFGLPWYRPIRLCFVPSGADFGWRTGSGKWPDHYLDGIPPVLNIGQGSPTGLVSIEGGRFPAEFQNNLLLFDWSYGSIYRVVLTAEGGGYSATAEPFLRGTPLPLTDGILASDGAVYFVSGGRSLKSYLFRVYYSKSGETVHPGPPPPEARIRRRIESDHTSDGRSIETDTLVSYLGHSDRMVRYAARVALERRSVLTWREHVADLTDAAGLANGVTAIARTGSRADLARALAALRRLDPTSLDDGVLLDVLRAYALVFARLGRPSESDRVKTIEELSGLFPSSSSPVNRELCRLLVYLKDPLIPERTLPLLLRNTEPSAESSQAISQVVTDASEYADLLNEMLEAGVMAQSVSYALSLSHATEGWTDSLRKSYFDWFQQAMEFKGGPSYRSYLDLIRGTALAGLPEDQKTQFLYGHEVEVTPRARPRGPGRSWTAFELANAWNHREELARSFDEGRAMFQAALCESCHAVRGTGGNIGPDLTKVLSRFSVGDLIKAIVTPSQVVPERYATAILKRTDGSSVSGTILREDAKSLLVNRNVFDLSDTVRVDKSEIMSRELSKVSVMPSGLLNTLNEQEVVNLLLYLQAEGDPNSPVYSER